MYFKREYQKWVFTEAQIKEHFPDAPIVQNDYLVKASVAILHHFNAVALELRTQRYGFIGGTAKINHKLGYIIRFLDDLLAPKESNPGAEKVYLADFKGTPIRVVIYKNEVVAIGNFMDDCFALLGDSENSLWGVDR